MVVLANTRTAKTSLTFVITRKILALMLNGNFSRPAMEKARPCDGVGVTVKRLTAKASLQRCAENKLDEQILTPTALCAFCKKNIANIQCEYATNEDYLSEYQLLQERHNKACTLMGTQRLHHFEPMSTSKLKVVLYDKDWWLGYVTDKNTEETTVKINFWTPKGPSPSFTYSERPDILNVPYCDILSAVSATPKIGRTYTLEEAEQRKATIALQKHIKVSCPKYFNLGCSLCNKILVNNIKNLLCEKRKN